MRETFLPFSKPSIDEDDIAAVGDVLRSGWITTGAKAELFEEKFRECVNCEGCVAVSSATAGMHLILEALGISPGDEIITPSMTWVSTVNLIVLKGAKPVFVDVDRNTLMTTPDRIAERITDRTRMIIPVHFAGAAVDMAPVREIACRKDITIVEDAAHALGTRYSGAPVGQEGTSIFSFHPIKNITTAEGGMVCSNDEVLLDRVKRLKFHGLGSDAYDREAQGRAPQAEVQEPGYKYNMPDILAVLGLRQLARLEEFNRKRKGLAEKYLQALGSVEEILPLEVPSCTTQHAWHLFIVRLDTDRSGMSRDDFAARLKKLNIGTGIHFRAVHLHKFYRERMGFKQGMLPDTEWNSDRVLSLPLFPGMNADDVDTVIDGIKHILSS